MSKESDEPTIIVDVAPDEVTIQLEVTQAQYESLRPLDLDAVIMWARCVLESAAAAAAAADDDDGNNNEAQPPFTEI